MSVEQSFVPLPPKDQQNCGNCYSYIAAGIRNIHSERDGFCRHNPPQVQMRVPYGSATAMNPEPFQPEVWVTDWCAQWAPNQ